MLKAVISQHASKGLACRSRILVTLLLILAVISATILSRGHPRPTSNRVVRIHAIRPGGAREGLGVLLNHTQVLTCYHIVAGASNITFYLSSGGTIEATGIAFADERKDLVVVNLASHDMAMTFPTMASAPVRRDEQYRIQLFGQSEAACLLGTEYVGDFGRVLVLRAPAEPGWSGAPVLDSSGQIVGVCSFLVGSDLHAIPVNLPALLRSSSTPMLMTAWSQRAPTEISVERTTSDRAAQLIALGHYSEASRLLAPAISTFHNTTVLRIALAQCYVALGDRPAALEALRVGALRDIPDVSYWIAAGQLLSDTGRLQEAQVALQRAAMLCDGPKSLIIATMLVRAGLVEQANLLIGGSSGACVGEQELRDAVQSLFQEKAFAAMWRLRQYVTTSNDPEGIVVRYACMAGLGIGYYDDVVRILEQRRAVGATTSRDEYIIGRALLKLGRDGEAIDALRRGAAIDPWDADIAYELGIAFRALQQHDEARQWFRKSAEVLPRADAVVNMGIELSALGRDREAVDAFFAGIRLDVASTEAYFWLASKLEERGNCDAAAAIAEAGSMLCNGGSELRELAAVMRAEMGEAMRAIELLRWPVRAGTDVGRVHLMLADLYASIGNVFQAEQERHKWERWDAGREEELQLDGGLLR